MNKAASRTGTALIAAPAHLRAKKTWMNGTSSADDESVLPSVRLLGRTVWEVVQINRDWPLCGRAEWI